MHNPPNRLHNDNGPVHLTRPVCFFVREKFFRIKSSFRTSYSTGGSKFRLRSGRVPVPEGSMFAHLHECAKLSIFTEDFLISEAKNMSDRNYELYVEKKRSRAEGEANVLGVMKDMNFPAEQIAEVQARLAAMAAKQP